MYDSSCVTSARPDHPPNKEMSSSSVARQPRHLGNTIPEPNMAVAYTGGQNDICPITHKRFPEIEIPVAFRWNLSQPYECAALAQWLRASSRDPMTNLRIERDGIMDVIVPLCGYSTLEAVHAMVVDLIGKISAF